MKNAFNKALRSLNMIHSMLCKANIKNENIFKHGFLSDFKMKLSKTLSISTVLNATNGKYYCCAVNNSPGLRLWST